MEVIIAVIEDHSFENGFINWAARIGYCEASHGSYLYEVVLSLIVMFWYFKKSKFIENIIKKLTKISKRYR